MGTHEERICRLCLKICDNVKAIEGDIKNSLDLVLPDIDLAVIQEPIICTNCTEIVVKCFDFKTKCISTHDYISPFVNKKEAVKLDLIDVYLNVTGASVSEDQNICGFCMNPVKNCSVISLDVKEGDIKLKNMIEQCFSELNLSIIEKPVICEPCHDSLKNCFRFVTNCLIVEEKIKKYCETLNKNSKHQIKLSSLLQCTVINVPRSEVDDNLVDIIKVQKQFSEERENADEEEITNGGDLFKLEQILCDDSENVKQEVEHKNVDTDDLKVNKGELYALKNMLACREDCDIPDVIKIEETFCEENEVKEETEDQQFSLKEEIEVQTDELDFNSFRDHKVTDQALSEVTMENLENLDEINNYQNPLKITGFKCQSCSFVAKRKAHLKVHMFIHREVYNCDRCSYKTKYKNCLEKHLLTHEKLSKATEYSCESCAYQAKCNNDLKRHTKRIHGNNVYNCDRCSFKTKYKDSVEKHMLTHRDLSEVTVYTCESCSFVTKHKGNLKKHMLVHQEPLEGTVYKCENCTYVTNRKYNFTLHVKQVHQPECNIYYCHQCSFKTKNKSYLKMHVLVHREPSEIPVYKCDSCSYVAKQKGSLKLHKLVHQEPSEVTVYKCDICTFQTKRKDYLKSHNKRIHEALLIARCNVYSCDQCPFETKFKKCLETHMLIHRKLSELTDYKCESCSFVTNYKSNLKLHMLEHQENSRVCIYKCYMCAYATDRKSNLNLHMKRTHESSEIAYNVYNCDKCLFETKYKTSLRVHKCIRKSRRTIYKCESCEYETNSPSNFNNHKESHQSSEITH